MNHDQAQLAALMHKVVQGTPSALGELYELTVDALNAVAMRLLRNTSDAEEVLCDVYKQIWERPRQYQIERGPVIAWLFIIVRTRALDLIRKRRDTISLDAVSPQHWKDESEWVEQGCDLLQSLQEKSVLREALLQLNAVQQRMLDLAFFQDMSHQEIADATGMALGTVKSHIRRGQQALEQILTKNGFCYE